MSFTHLQIFETSKESQSQNLEFRNNPENFHQSFVVFTLQEITNI